jgi:hypothetical protein
MAAAPEGMVEPGLVYDSGQSRARPGLHALIVGVSEYSYLPGPEAEGEEATLQLKRLTSAARSACLVAEWVLANSGRFVQPLASVRVLLAPSDAEHGEPGNRCERAARAELDQFLDSAAHWRRDLSPCSESVALFYFAGHGMQGAAADQVLILEDFGANPEAGSVLRKSVSTSSLIAGLAPTEERPDIARQQWFFFDCCRDTQRTIRKTESADPTAAFSWATTLQDDREVSLFNAAISGARARARPNDLTVFGRAVLDCLNGSAGERREDRSGWHVSTGSLGRALSMIGDKLELADSRVKFDVQPRGNLRRSMVLLGGAPHVKITLEIHPPAALKDTGLAIWDGHGASVEVSMPLDPNPYECRWPAGAYRVDTQDSASNVRRLGEYEEVLPPHWSWVGP